MNKSILAVLLLVVVAITWFIINSSGNELPSKTAEISGKSVTAGGEDSSNPSAEAGADIAMQGAGDPAEVNAVEDRPATDLYKSAEEALKAVKDGASRYDDVILQQFTQLGPDCSWCDTFYKSIQDTLKEGTLPTDQKSYFAELLAISGKAENVEALLNFAETSPEGENKNLFSEALELVIGNDKVVQYLGDKLASTTGNELKESLVAAISNQGSSLSVDTLYKYCTSSGNADCYYSAGTGLGEVIPDEEAYPALQQIISKRDDYSHNGVKALLNSGVEGLKKVFETMATTNDVEKDRKILREAAEHISFDEDTQAYLRDMQAKTKNPALAELAKTTLDNFDREESESANGDVGEEFVEEEQLTSQDPSMQQ